MRRRNRNKKRITIGALTLFLLIMTAGYAAFNTNLNLTAQGNIVTTPERCFTVADNGDGTCTITNYDVDACGTKVKIPNSIKNLTVTKIADYVQGSSDVFHQKGITYLKLPSKLVYIGESSFEGIRTISLDFPDTVRVISGRAFQYSSLKKVNLNEGLETLGWAVFEGANLESLSIPSTVKNLNNPLVNGCNLNENDAFVYRRDENGQIDYTHLISYGGTLVNVKIPDGVKSTGSYSLSNEYMKTITFSESVERIGYQSLGHVPSLEEVNVGSNIVVINEVNFQYAPNLKSININRKKDAVDGSPWGATNVTVNWTGIK